MKYIDFKRYKFSTITKKVNIIRYKFLKLIDFGRYNFRKIYKYFNFRKLNFYKLDNFNFRRLNFYRLSKKINFKNYRYLPIYFVASVILIAFMYVTIPIFYSYDKSQIGKIICKNYKIECLIKGEVKYSFYPTPRITIKDLAINDLSKKKNVLATVKSVSINLSRSEEHTSELQSQ